MGMWALHKLCAGMAVKLLFSVSLQLRCAHIARQELPCLLPLVATRCYALHAVILLNRLPQTPIACPQMQEGGELDAPEDAAEGTGTAGAPGSSSPARRRTRGPRPALLRAVAAAGRPLSLLNLRLSLVDRDFTDQVGCRGGWDQTASPLPLGT